MDARTAPSNGAIRDEFSEQHQHQSQCCLSYLTLIKESKCPISHV